MASRHPKQIVAENIRRARLEHGLTQKQLARLVNDTDPMSISRWERGEVSPSDLNLVALAEALGHDFAWFYTDHGNGRVAA